MHGPSEGAGAPAPVCPVTPSRFLALPFPWPLFQMSFYFSDTAVLLFDFWSVHTPTGRLPAPAWPQDTRLSVRLSATSCALCLGKRMRGRETNSGFAFLAGAVLAMGWEEGEQGPRPALTLGHLLHGGVWAEP